MEEITLINNIYSKIVCLGKAYLVRSEKTEEKTWRLQAVCLSNPTSCPSRCWEATFDLPFLEELKQSTEFKSCSWKSFFESLRSAFLTDDIFISTSNEALSMNIWCPFEDTQITLSFELQSTISEDSSETGLTFIVFSLIDVLRSANSNVTAPSTSSGHTLENSFSSMGSLSLYGEQVAPSLSVDSVRFSSYPNKKRKLTRNVVPGRSIINPRIKKWPVAKGAKIANSKK
eukprot:TRINITY_DN9447_c0_g1_i1.p1 TRINITY_DN9447_c0_g1~~TRINITY_DN9447_c0_g1_i1.p1  ORF type:complete len:230 (-),score=18.68 TRINITY_DN9447_c0_g1_i1:147-836(-)